MENELEYAVAGLVVFTLARFGARSEDRGHFGSWRPAPPWARNFFGSDRGSISPYHLAAQVAALVWIVGGLLLWFGGNPPATPWRQLIAAPMGLALIGCLVAWVIAFLGEQRRLG